MSEKAPKYWELYAYTEAFEPRLKDSSYSEYIDANGLVPFDEFIVSFTKSAQFQRDNPLMADAVTRNVEWVGIWGAFKREHLTIPLDLAKGLFQGLIHRAEELSKPVIRELNEESKILLKLIENDVVALLEREGSTLDELGTYHLGFGRSIYIISRMLHEGRIRPDQAKTMLKWSYEAIPGTVLQDLILDNQEYFNEVEGDALGELIMKLITDNPKPVAEIRAGKEKAVGFLVGQLLKQHKLDPGAAKAAILAKIAEA